MKAIFNNTSLHGQFCDVDEAGDYFSGVFIRLYRALTDNHVMLYKNSETFACKVTPSETLLDIMNMHGVPYVSVLRLVVADPYLDTLQDEVADAFWQDVKLLTVDESQDRANDGKRADYSYNGTTHNLEQFCTYKGVLEALVRDSTDRIIYALSRYPYMEERRVVLSEFVKKDINRTKFTPDDAVAIVQNLDMLILFKSKGESSHWWGSLVSKEGIFEYRLSISANREYRITFLWDKDIKFLTAFIKKSQTTPKAEIDRACKVKRNLGRL